MIGKEERRIHITSPGAIQRRFLTQETTYLLDAQILYWTARQYRIATVALNHDWQHVFCRGKDFVHLLCKL